MPVGFPFTSSSGYDFVYNWKPLTNLTNWRAAKQRVQSNSGNARILCIGDSTTFGVGSTGSLTAGNMIPLSYPTKLSAALLAGGLNASWDSWNGSGSLSGAGSPARGGNDSRLNFHGAVDWSQSTAPTFGGQHFFATSGGTNPLSFTPTHNVDTFLVMYYNNSSGSGKLKIDIDGGTAQQIDGTLGTGQISSATITAGAVGSHTLNMNWVSGTAYCPGMFAYDSTKSVVDVANAGVSGCLASYFNTNGIISGNSPVAALGIHDLFIIDLGINDWVNSTALGTWASAMQTNISACKAYGDVILMSPNPSGQTTGGGETGIPLTNTQLQFINTYRALSLANNVPLFDLWNRWGSYEGMAAVPTPLVFNNYHPIAAGYTDIASFLAAPLLSA